MKQNIHLSRNNILYGSESPVGRIVPEYIGQYYLDVEKDFLYISKMLSNKGWIPLNGEDKPSNKIVREQKDERGLYTIVKEFDENSILLKKSILSDRDSKGLYLTQTIEYYSNGVINQSYNYSLIYDNDNKFIECRKRG